MERITMGRTGLQVSPLGMGVIPISRLGWQESIDVVRGVMDLGINWFDTARAYLDTEQRLGEALLGRRYQVILTSKSMATTPEQLVSDMDESLQNLKTDYLDFFFFHGGWAIEEDSFLAPGGLLETAQDFVRAGKARFLGFSAHKVDLAMKGLEVEPLSSLMVPANFISREYLAEDLLDKARERGVAVRAMKPFGGGRIWNPKLCLKFLKTYPGVFPCIGIERVSEMAENIRTWEESGPLTQEDIAEMESIRESLGDRFCRQCGYCMPCPQGIRISQVNSAQVYAALFPRDYYLDWYTDRIEGAKECIECRECVEKCPYHLSVPEMLKENIAFFDQFMRAG